MAKLLKLIKESFELSVKMRWLKTINKEIDKCNKTKEQLDRQRYVVNALIEEYMEIYGEDLRIKEKDNG